MGLAEAGRLNHNTVHMKLLFSSCATDDMMMRMRKKAASFQMTLPQIPAGGQNARGTKRFEALKVCTFQFQGIFMIPQK